MSMDWSDLTPEKRIKRQTVNILLVDNTFLPLMWHDVVSVHRCLTSLSVTSSWKKLLTKRSDFLLISFRSNHVYEKSKCILKFLLLFCIGPRKVWDTRWSSWTRHCVTSRKAAGSNLDGNFYWRNHSSRTLALGSTQPLTELSTVKPRFTNASDHEQFGLRRNFPNTKRHGWRTVSRVTNMQAVNIVEKKTEKRKRTPFQTITFHFLTTFHLRRQLSSIQVR